MLTDRYEGLATEMVKAEVPHGNSMPAGNLLHACIVCLTLLEIIFAYRSALSGLPAFIAAKSSLAVELDLAEQGEILAIEIPQPVNTYAAAVPAVTEGDNQLILAFTEQIRNIVGLYTQSFMVVARAGCQHEATDARAVENRLIQTVTSDIQHGVSRIIYCETAAQNRGGLPLFLVMWHLGIDPFGLPSCGQAVLQKHTHVISFHSASWR